jgi:membrane protein
MPGPRPASHDNGESPAVAAPVSPEQGPSGPFRLPRRAWFDATKRAIREFSVDAVPDWAAALTYYGILSIFPALLVLVTAVGLLGESATDDIQGQLTDLAPGQVGEFLNQTISQVRDNGSAAGVVAILGLFVAFWSASGYIGAFMRASNAIYDVPEGRSVWKTIPTRLALTAGVGVLLVASALIVVFTGPLARLAGNLIGLGPAAVTVWAVAKWPVLVILVSLMFSLLYRVAPNARQGGWRWITFGGVAAVLAWLVISGMFAIYLSYFSSYDKTYGAISGVVVFLVWLWLTNLSILFGAEVNAELERARAMSTGHPPDAEPFLELRDDRNIKEGTDSGLGLSRSRRW